MRLPCTAKVDFPASPSISLSPILRAILFAPLLLLACSPKRYALSHVADAFSDTGEGSAFARDDDPELVRDAIPFALKTMEGLSDQLDDHVGLRLALARGYTQYAYAFLQQPAELGAPPDQAQAALLRARKLYLRAREYGVEGLRLARGVGLPELRKPGALVRLQKEDVPLLYWTLVPWAAAIAANKRDLELLGDLPLIGAMLDRALQLDEGYDGGALHEFAITFDPARPEGTTVAKQRQHFERARVLANGEKISYLVTYAESVSGPAQNKREYEALLKEAAAFDVEQSKARNNRLANVLAQRRARYLLAHEDDVFPD
jgi:predicted anti-sigma-YlaC factor YlaD